MSNLKNIRLYAGLISCIFNVFLAGHGFVAGTQIETPGGFVPIETLQENDLVISRDKANGTFVEKPVQTCIKHTIPELIELLIEDTEILVGPDQPFYVLAERKWYAAKDLKTGQALSKKDGGFARISKIRRVKKDTRVYDLAIQDCHNFCVSDQRIIAHNVAILAAVIGYMAGTVPATTVGTAVLTTASAAAATAATAVTTSATALASTVSAGFVAAAGYATGTAIVQNAHAIGQTAFMVGQKIDSGVKVFGKVVGYAGDKAFRAVGSTFNLIGSLFGGNSNTPPPVTPVQKPPKTVLPQGPGLSISPINQPGINVISPLGIKPGSNIALTNLGTMAWNTVSAILPQSNSSSIGTKTRPGGDKPKETKNRGSKICAAGGAPQMPGGPNDPRNNRNNSGYDQHTRNNPNDNSGPKIKPKSPPKWEIPGAIKTVNFSEAPTAVLSKYAPDLNLSQAEKHVCDLPGSSFVGKVVGWQWYEGKVILRADFDPGKGAHFNFKDSRPGKKTNIAIEFSGGIAAVNELLATLNTSESVAAVIRALEEKVADEAFEAAHPLKIGQYKSWIEGLRKTL